MKEPWEIYADETQLEIQRVKKAAAEGHRKMTRSELENAEYVAAEACFYHLIEELNLKEWEAEEVVERFQSCWLALLSSKCSQFFLLFGIFSLNATLQ